MPSVTFPFRSLRAASFFPLPILQPSEVKTGRIRGGKCVASELMPRFRGAKQLKPQAKVTSNTISQSGGWSSSPSTAVSKCLQIYRGYIEHLPIYVLRAQSSCNGSAHFLQPLLPAPLALRVLDMSPSPSLLRHQSQAPSQSRASSPSQESSSARREMQSSRHPPSTSTGQILSPHHATRPQALTRNEYNGSSEWPISAAPTSAKE